MLINYSGEMMSEFATYIAGERERISSAIDQLTKRRNELVAEIDRDVAEAKRELEAIDAYESTKNGRPLGRIVKADAGNGRRVGMRNTVIETLRAAPAGLKRRELIAALGCEGDKSGGMAVSNALNALSKSGLIVRDEQRNRWVIAELFREAAQ